MYPENDIPEYEITFNYSQFMCRCETGCQDEPILIVETPEEADELLELWENGLLLDGQIK